MQEPLRSGGLMQELLRSGVAMQQLRRFWRSYATTAPFLEDLCKKHSAFFTPSNQPEHRSRSELAPTPFPHTKPTP